jgi:uncharacterized repeat protein (TIGR04042 family)
MPEMRFQVRWPDDSVSVCYSPSLVVKDFLAVGESYPLDDFVKRCREALDIASERVKQKYGFYCTGASSTLEEIEMIAGRFVDAPECRVSIIAFD